MKNIKILDAKTAAKIAAGEVIERPSGVLKELIENSLDSQATAINIEIEKAGKTLIRVNDNGQGIAAEDMPAALLRHATSKIDSFDDLNTLNTFGFRGEALYSIAAISKISLYSCAENGKGALLQAEGGKITAQAPAPSVKGTTVEVRDLFFNTPARLKFLKSDAVERSHLLLCAEEAALANPQTAFNVKTDGRKIYSLPAKTNDQNGLRSRIAKILGDEVAKDLIYIEDKQFGFRAFVSPSDKLSPARDRQFFFVNKRPVSCKLLQQALYKAYQPYREKDKHPTAVLFMEIPPDEFDVNIHPQKKDIKFAAENDIFSFIYSKIAQNILKEGQSASIKIETSFQPAESPAPTDGQNNFKPFSPIAPPQKNTAFTPTAAQSLSALLGTNTIKRESSLQARDSEEPPTYNLEKDEETQIVYQKNENAKQEKSGEQNSFFIEENHPLWFKGPYTYLGQLQNSYLLFENPQGLILIDQHAAQERIYFEEYLSQIENAAVKVQPLMFPVNVSLPASKLEAVLSWRGDLEKTGFDIARFSQNSLSINSVPNLLKFKEEGIKDFIVSLSDVVGDPTKSDDGLKYRLISTMACKKAVKAGEKLEKVQAEALLNNMKKCKDALHCPHGRPTLITLEMKEITRKFGRS